MKRGLYKIYFIKTFGIFFSLFKSIHGFKSGTLFKRRKVVAFVVFFSMSVSFNLLIIKYIADGKGAFFYFGYWMAGTSYSKR